ncbi:MAG: hypothetical protein H0X66_12135 [Verrucomicrobia bacterium]|nr:hypothetical protein [Verrucomicrobiota bacterium]
MKISKAKAPFDAYDTVRQNVNDVVRKAPEFLHYVTVEKLRISEPDTSYFVRLDELISGRLCAAAQLNSWRFLLSNGDEVIGEVELNANEKRGKLMEFVAIHQTHFSAASVQALKKAEKLTKENGQYEVRQLKIPSVYLVAIWFHSETDDLIVPLPPAPNGIEAFQFYSEQSLINLLQPAANAARIRELSLRGNASDSRRAQ